MEDFMTWSGATEEECKQAIALISEARDQIIEKVLMARIGKVKTITLR